MNAQHDKVIPKYNLVYDIERDIWNWYYGANYSDNGERHFRDVSDLSILKEVMGLSSLEQSEPILRPFLEEKINNPKSKLNEFIEKARWQFSRYFISACEAIERITKKPLAKTEFTFYVTTFPRMVVFYDEGIIFSYAEIDDELWGMPLDGFLHEALHFQTDKYWRNNPDSPVSELSDDEYFKLKESLTVILDEELKPIITLPDCSYPQFKDLREDLHKYWKRTHNFDDLISYGVTRVKEA